MAAFVKGTLGSRNGRKGLLTLWHWYLVSPNFRVVPHIPILGKSKRRILERDEVPMIVPLNIVMHPYGVLTIGVGNSLDQADVDDLFLSTLPPKAKAMAREVRAALICLNESGLVERGIERIVAGSIRPNQDAGLDKAPGSDFAGSSLKKLSRGTLTSISRPVCGSVRLPNDLNA
ncbi:hypothetical protein FOPE_06547 [Fonsecaea pedrosoi]|nr:hypothetical protein FOPE_06547 [Fonsecaea pedrosoi]